MEAGIGLAKLKAPVGVSCVSLPQEDGSTLQVRPAADRTVEVSQDVAVTLVAHGFEVIRPARNMPDEALDVLRTRRDELEARLDDLRAQEADLAADASEVTARLEAAKASLATSAGSVRSVRSSEKRLAETSARAVVIAEAITSVREELSDVEGQISVEEDVRDLARQTDAAAPLIDAANAAAEAFAEAIAGARDALVERVATLDRLGSECPRIAPPTLTLKELGAALQEALGVHSIEQDLLARTSFERFALTVLVGPYFRPDSAEAIARLDAVRVNR